MSSGNWHSCKWQTIQRHLSSRHTSFSEHWSTRPLANPHPFTLKTACRAGWKRDVKATLLLTRLVSEAYQQPNFLTAICPHPPGTNTYQMEQGGLTNIGLSTWTSWLSRKGSGVQDIRISFQNGRNNTNNNNYYYYYYCCYCCWKSYKNSHIAHYACTSESTNIKCKIILTTDQLRAQILVL